MEKFWRLISVFALLLAAGHTDALLRMHWPCNSTVYYMVGCAGTRKGDPFLEGQMLFYTG
ncbi:unnamed protein product [Penicillium roqueforti FM164]|uniref:Genomic scaffold, ProqFM164S03 n=1 Tax=Penicillium roqueforti (strain FM164) TaxID=1365484 RepID=W6QB26_PENRF|nr:unnamed protein product [Penicillium roqueforti FM164]